MGFAWQRVPTPRLRPRQRPNHGTAMVASMATDLVWAMEVMVLATATARGLLMPMPTPGMDMEDSMVTDSQPMVATDTDCGARRRGPLMLRPNQRLTHGSAMAMEVLAMDTERGPLRPSQRLTPGSDMVDSTATVLAWAMAAMAMEVLATDTERGPLRPSLRPMPGTDMVAFTATDSPPMAVTATDCGERSKHDQKHRLIITCNKPNDLIGLDP